MSIGGITMEMVMYNFKEALDKTTGNMVNVETINFKDDTITVNYKGGTPEVRNSDDISFVNFNEYDVYGDDI